MTARSLAHRAQILLLSLSAVVGVVCLVLLLLGPLAGIRPLIVRSGSMEPAYPTGSLVLARTVSASAAAPGDVVVVERGGQRIMHRVLEIDPVRGSTDRLLTLKGDANAGPDIAQDQVAEVPRVFAHVPELGTVVAWLTRPPGVLVLAAHLALCAWLLLAPAATAVGGRHRGDAHDRAADR